MSGGIPSEIKEKVAKAVAELKDWERKPILRVGSAVAEFVKLPGRKTRAGDFKPERVAIHIRLEDSFKGVVIEKEEELRDLARLASAERLSQIARALDEINKPYKRPEVEEYI